MAGIQISYLERGSEEERGKERERGGGRGDREGGKEREKRKRNEVIGWIIQMTRHMTTYKSTSSLQNILTVYACIHV